MAEYPKYDPTAGFIYNPNYKFNENLDDLPPGEFVRKFLKLDKHGQAQYHFHADRAAATATAKARKERRIGELPFIIRETARNRIKDLDEEAADALLARCLDTPHNNSTAPFYASPTERTPRAANAWICDLDHQEIGMSAKREIDRLTALAARNDRMNRARADRNWCAILNSIFNNPNPEVWLAADESTIPYSLPPSAILDMPSELQIKKKLYKIKRQTNDEFAMALKLIGRHAPYQKVGSWNVKEREMQKKRWSAWAEKSTAVNPTTGESIRLSEIVKKQRKARLAEVYTLSKGLQTCAEKLGMKWCFAVLTAPPQFHPNPAFSAGGKDKWDGSLPTDSHHFILNKWKVIKDELRHNFDVRIPGFRGPESHDDTCTHSNLMFFAHPSDMVKIKKVIRAHFNWHDAAVDFKEDDGRASFASYCMKYATKSLGASENETDANDAWYSTWSIRRYQFFGIPSLSTWRTLRSVKDFDEFAPGASITAKSIWRAAKRGDAATFIELNGGLNVGKSERPIHARCEKVVDEAGAEARQTTIEENESIVYTSARPIYRIKTVSATPKTEAPTPKPAPSLALPVILELSKRTNPEPQTQKPNLVFNDFGDFPDPPPTLH